MVWIGVEEFLYKGNVGFLGGCYQNFPKLMFFFFLL